jgi:hypothetical protein
LPRRNHKACGHPHVGAALTVGAQTVDVNTGTSCSPPTGSRSPRDDSSTTRRCRRPDPRVLSG